MTLQEYVDYALTIAAQAGAEPSLSPILDADMLVQFMLPAVLREAVRKTAQSGTEYHSVIQIHGLEINRGLAALPNGVEEEFARFMQVGLWEDAFRVAYDFATSKSASSNDITLFHGTSAFNQLIHTGWRAKVISSSTGDELLNAIIESIDSTASNVATLRDYVTGSIATTVSNGLTSLYEPQYILARTIAAVAKSGSTDLVTDSGSTNTGTDADIGHLMIIKVAGVTVLRGIIADVKDPNTFEVPGYDSLVISGGVATIYRLATVEEAEEGYFDATNIGEFSWYPQYADYVRETDELLPRFCVRDKKIFVAQSDGFTDGDGIILYAVTVPQIPSSPTAEIDVGEQIMDTALMMTASILKGELPLASVGLNLQVMKAKKK